MENILKIAKLFIFNITVILRQVSGVSEEEYYVPYEVEIIKADGKSMKYNVLVDNIFVDNNNRVRNIENTDFIKQVLLQYIYNKNGNSGIREKFPKIFNIEERKLLLEYFRATSNLKQIDYIKCN